MATHLSYRKGKGGLLLSTYGWIIIAIGNIAAFFYKKKLMSCPLEKNHWFIVARYLDFRGREGEGGIGIESLCNITSSQPSSFMVKRRLWDLQMLHYLFEESLRSGSRWSVLVLRVVFRFLQSMNCCKRLTPKNDPDCLHNRKESGFGSIGPILPKIYHFICTQYK